MYEQQYYVFSLDMRYKIRPLHINIRRSINIPQLRKRLRNKIQSRNPVNNSHGSNRRKLPQNRQLGHSPLYLQCLFSRHVFTVLL
jgi:hypothetical protein